MIEFKVRTTPEDWENIPVIMWLDTAQLQFILGFQNDNVGDDLAETLVDMTGAPVRWNREGSLQGHYVEES